MPKNADLSPLFIKAVQSPNPPKIEHAFPITVSTNCPMVIRDGMACGLIMISGRIPSSVKGMSSSGITNPTVPFCPHLEQNLSPIIGSRSSRTRIFAMRNPSSPSVINDLSTNPCCPFFGNCEESMELSGFSRFVMTLPIKTVLSSNFEFSSIRPCSSNLE